jgi:membrane-associated protein
LENVRIMPDPVGAAKAIFDVRALIEAFGYTVVFGFVFAESGLLVGFFLPGDSLLFTAGFLASQGFLNIAVLAAGSFVCAVAGDSVGYTFGYRVGRRLFQREDSIWFHKKHLYRAQAFYEQHGGKALILARFMPVVRTFAPIVAGLGSMNYPRFVLYTLVGAVIWAAGVTWAGYYLGSVIPDVDKYLLPIVALIIVASIAPSVVHVWRENGSDISTWARERLGRRGAALLGRAEDDRCDVERAHARVRALVRAHVDPRDRLARTRDQPVGEGLRLANQGEHAAVVVRVRVDVEQPGA